MTSQPRWRLTCPICTMIKWNVNLPVVLLKHEHKKSLAHIELWMIYDFTFFLDDLLSSFSCFHFWHGVGPSILYSIFFLSYVYSVLILCFLLVTFEHIRLGGHFDHVNLREIAFV